MKKMLILLLHCDYDGAFRMLLSAIASNENVLFVESGYDMIEFQFPEN